VRRVGPLVALLAAVWCPVLAGQSGRRPTGYNPYDSNEIRAGIRWAALEHTIAPNYVTLDITVTKTDGTPPTANYDVYLSFNEPGRTPPRNPQQCQEEHVNSPGVPRGGVPVYPRSSAASGNGSSTARGPAGDPSAHPENGLHHAERCPTAAGF